MSHKNIPCPKCNRIWMWLDHATPENPVCPEGYGCNVKLSEPTIKELFDEVLRRLDAIEMKITGIQPIVPILPTTRENFTKCSKCGKIWSGVEGYVCGNHDCPVQVRAR